MPEMFAFCGKKFQVYKRAHKTCDTVFPVRGRRLHRAVHLATRCDGKAHGGCQATCLIFWKEAWLKPLGRASEDSTGVEAEAGSAERCTESEVWSHAQVSDPKDGQPRYVCQATRLPYATTDLKWWDIRQ